MDTPFLDTENSVSAVTKSFSCASMVDRQGPSNQAEISCICLVDSSRITNGKDEEIRAMDTPFLDAENSVSAVTKPFSCASMVDREGPSNHAEISCICLVDSSRFTNGKDEEIRAMDALPCWMDADSSKAVNSSMESSGITEEDKKESTEKRASSCRNLLGESRRWKMNEVEEEEFEDKKESRDKSASSCRNLLGESRKWTMNEVDEEDLSNRGGDLCFSLIESCHFTKGEEETVRPCFLATEMDERLWSGIPHHLFDLVLARLPFWSLLRFKSVCRRWNCIMDSKTFIDSYSQTPCKDLLFLMYADYLQHKVAAAYNPGLNQWHLIPLSHILPSEPPNYFLILASAGGILCVEDMGWPSRSLVVSNFVTRSRRKLPPMIPMRSPYVVGMIVEENRECYKILVVQDGEILTSQYYDSRTDSWKMSGSFNRRMALVAGTVFVKGFLYCLTFGPVGLVAYNVEDESWHEIQVSMPPSLTCPHVIEHDGKLMMIGGVEEFGSLKSIQIWQLNLADNTWLELHRMPNHLFQKLFSIPRGNFFCVAYRGFICFNDNHSPHILMLDMAHKKWWWLPPCPLNHIFKRQSVLGVQTLGFSIEPRLDALV